MKSLIIISLLLSFSNGMTKKCEGAMNYSTKIHMKYADGKVKKKKTYLASKIMKKACKNRK